MIRALGHCSITISLDRLKVKGRSTLPTWSRSKRNLNPANHVRFPSHQSCGCTITCHYQQEITLLTFPQERTAGSSLLGTSLLGTLLNSASASLPLTDLNLCPFTVMNHSHEQSSFQVSSESSYWVIKTYSSATSQTQRKNLFQKHLSAHEASVGLAQLSLPSAWMEPIPPWEGEYGLILFFPLRRTEIHLLT